MWHVNAIAQVMRLYIQTQFCLAGLQHSFTLDPTGGAYSTPRDPSAGVEGMVAPFPRTLPPAQLLSLCRPHNVEFIPTPLIATTKYFRT